MPEGAENAQVDVNDPSDQQVEKMEQERLVLQLKEMIRDRETALAGKDSELTVIFIFLKLFLKISMLLKLLFFHCLVSVY